MTIRQGFEKAREYYASIGDTEMVEGGEKELHSSQAYSASGGERSL